MALRGLPERLGSFEEVLDLPDQRLALGGDHFVYLSSARK
jgi:hypothetical protein